LRFGAFQRHPRLCPFVEQAVRARPGAALRISHPLSGFSVDRVPRPYFMPQPFLDCPPSRVFPSRRSWILSRGHQLPCSYPQCFRNAPPATLSPEVSPTPTLLAQSPGSPSNYGFPFHGSEGPLPGPPGSPTAGSSPPPASPASKLSSLRESVRTDPSEPES